MFDVEAIFLYPWALIFKDVARNRETRPIGFLEMLFCLSVVAVGYIYLWNKGAFDWHKYKKLPGSAY